MRSLAPTAAACLAAGLCIPVFGGPVIVQLDMDPARPGMQSDVYVPPGTTVVPVAVYIYDPQGRHSAQSIGYIGALDRGIALGNIPRAGNHGQVTDLVGIADTPVNPASTGQAFPAQDRGFDGPEIQYIEYNALAPAPIATAPLAPVFRAEIHLSGAAEGDLYLFAVMDFVAVWRQGANGAFSTAHGLQLDTGGDITPDGTQGRFAIDPDRPVPVPPAAFQVDFVDGGIHPARLHIGGCPVNCDDSTIVPLLNVNDFLCFQARLVAGDLYTNCDGSTFPPVLNVNDFICFQARFAEGCP